MFALSSNKKQKEENMNYKTIKRTSLLPAWSWHDKKNSYAQSSNSVVFCSNCKNISSYNEWYSKSDYCQCPVCNEKHADILPVTGTFDSNVSFCSYTLFENENGKITLKIRFKAYFVMRERFFEKNCCFVFVYNTRTGQSYMLPTKDNKGQIVKLARWNNSLTNITYNGLPPCEMVSLVDTFAQCPDFSIDVAMAIAKMHSLDENIVAAEWKQAIVKMKARIYDKETSQTPSMVEVRTTMKALALFNRLPMFPIEKIFEMASVFIRSKKISYLFSNIKQDDIASLAIEKILSKAKLKNKTNKKALIGDLRMVYSIEYFKLFGFTSVDLFERFAKTRITFDRTGRFCGEKNIEYMSDFLSHLISLKGESTVIKMLETDAETRQWFTLDSAMLYSKIKKNSPEDITSRVLKGSIADIHERLSRIADEKKHTNKQIEYPYLNAEEYHHICNGIEFKPATGTYELILVGRTMHICVGGYGDNAVSHRCIIVVGRREGIPVICIELDGRGRELRQVKAPYNEMLQGDEAQAFREWLKKTPNINTDGCWDYNYMNTSLNKGDGQFVNFAFM